MTPRSNALCSFIKRYRAEPEILNMIVSSSAVTVTSAGAEHVQSVVFANGFAVFVQTDLSLQNNVKGVPFVAFFDDVRSDHRGGFVRGGDNVGQGGFGNVRKQGNLL